MTYKNNFIKEFCESHSIFDCLNKDIFINYTFSKLEAAEEKIKELESEIIILRGNK
jgi:hypothetical protein